jgi:hypothetical protein
MMIASVPVVMMGVVVKPVFLSQQFAQCGGAQLHETLAL